MKTKKLLVAAFIAVALLLVASCTMPEYQLEWVVNNTSPNGDYVAVNYTLYNTGFEKLYDVIVEIEVAYNSNEYATYWTTPVDLSVGESRNFTTPLIDIGAGTSPLSSITGAAWNIE